MGIGASLVNISQAGGLNSWIWAEGVDANHDNWAYIMGLFGDLPPQGGTIVFPEQVPLKYPLCVPTGVKFLGTGQTPQAIDAGVPLHLYYGTQFTPTGDWAGASQAGHTTIAAASNGLTLPQTTIALASAAGSAQSPAFTSAGYVLVQTIPVGGPGSYDGGWNLVQYTSIIGNVLQGCTLPFSGNAGASQMFLGLPVVQAQPVTGCTIDAHNVATVVAANSYYPGQPVIVMCNGFTGTYQPASVFEVIAATPTQFQIQLLGNAGGSFSASGSATAPYDTLLCLPNPHATLEALAVVPGTTVNRGVGLGASDWHLRWLFAYQGIVAEVDSDPQSPANTTRGEMTVCYMEQGIGAVGASFICQGNNLRATNLYKTGGILYDMGGACNWLGSHLAGGYPYNTYFGSSSRWAACQWDSLAANGTALLANGGRPSNPGVSLAGCSFFNSVGSMATPLNVPILHNLTSGGQGVTIAGDCVADSSQYGAWSLLSDNPGEADQVLDGFMTSGTLGRRGIVRRERLAMS